MSLIRNFKGRKYWRTYIGGTVTKEIEIFNEVQGIEEDNSDCNWLEYKRIFTTFYDDTLHVTLSWRNLTFELASILLGFMFSANIIPATILCVLAFILLLISLRLNIILSTHLKYYSFSMDIILSEIEKESGLKLSKN